MNYISIATPFEYEFEVKKSRFICYLYPVQSVEAAQDYLNQIKKGHYKANHHCSAFILQPDSSIQRMSDDGEPSGTAGIPMLEVLKQYPVTNILAVVVRYFGGIKLGASGLVRAYSKAVSESLKLAPLVQIVSQMTIKLTLTYPQVDSFNYWLSHSDYEVNVLDTSFTDKVTYHLSIPIELTDLVQASLTQRFNGHFDWVIEGQKSLAVPYQKQS